MRVLLVIISLMLLLVGCEQAEPEKEKLDLNDRATKMSYALGLEFGMYYKDLGETLQKEALMQGISDALSAASPQLSQAEVRQIMRSVHRELMQKQQERLGAMADQNKTEGEAFLATNKQKTGVITLPSGLQYKVIQEGTGRQPTLNDKVVVHYRGELVNGEVFDSSYDRGQPSALRVDQVIKGWQEALTLMKEGAKWELYIPPELAYGARGSRPNIGPHAVLIFELELISIR